MKPNTNPMMMTLVEERLTTQSEEEPLAAFFRYRHLPHDQAELAFPFAELAMLLIAAPKIPPQARHVALEALLEARLAIVPEASKASETDEDGEDEPEAPAVARKQKAKAKAKA